MFILLRSEPYCASLRYMTIAELRRERKLTQRELAEMMGVSHVTVARWETGTRTPSSLALFALSKALKCAQEEITIG